MTLDCPGRTLCKKQRTPASPPPSPTRLPRSHPFDRVAGLRPVRAREERRRRGRPPRGHRRLRRGRVSSAPRSPEPMSSASPPCSPRVRPATGARPCCCTRTTTCTSGRRGALGVAAVRADRPRRASLRPGAADDKAGIMAHVGAIRAGVRGHRATTSTSASPSSSRGRRSTVRAPSASSSPTTPRCSARTSSSSPTLGNWDERTPRLTVSLLRGNARFTLTVRTLEHASHSGMMGGAVPDAMLATVKLLATLWDDDGAVARRGLAVRDAETPDYDEATLRAESGLLEGVSPIGPRSILSASGTSRPSRSPDGMPPGRGGIQHHSPRRRASSSARGSLPGRTRRRLSPRSRRTCVRTPPSARSSSSPTSTAATPSWSTHSGWAVEEARASFADGYGVDSVDVGIGGSIPFISDLVREFPEAQILVTGVEDRTRGRTARTSRCTSRPSATRSSRRRCCWPASTRGRTDRGRGGGTGVDRLVPRPNNRRASP